MLTLMVPLNPHEQEHNRCRNVKLSYLLRWYLYTCFGDSYYRLAPQNAPLLQNGALCISAKRTCKFEPESVWKLLRLDTLLHYLQREKLCRYLQILDDGGVGKAIALPPIPINPTEKKHKAICIDAKRLHKGPGMNPGHIPYFARQMLPLMRDIPVADCHLSAEAYQHHFFLSQIQE